MKISIPKPPTVSRPAEPPAKGGNTGITPPTGKNTGIAPPKATNTGITPPKGTNTGIVPPKGTNTGSVPPSDSFHPATATGGKGGTSAASGTSGAALIPSTPSDYALSPNLEQFRGLFDSEGDRISKLPVEQQAGEIESTSNRLYEQLKEYATRDDVVSGLKASTAFYSRGSSTDDPMVFARAGVNYSNDPILGGGSVGVEGSGGFGTPGKPSAPSNDQGHLPKTGHQDRTEEHPHQRFRRMRHHF